ncbi:NRAMP family divalent metal transporter [Novosphingobium sp. JCM 18896]|uniref:NRAMP family divalent metal transporter n=1 Tax=Novosphingobium sp. JCM 18896 TaxID=2989731 RepID=UPI002222583B|nr:divalent metal cation transporter [Novosphingobium sp. JCM 18896]MCW1432442.1 divalent metal cation transporter [Novosphingobium sp. JCM 18896]
MSALDDVGGERDVPPSAVVEPTKPRLLKILGPGLVTGASDDDPSGIATYSQAGASFGCSLLWSLLFTYPLMVAVQTISARIGRTTGRGIAGNLRRHYPNAMLQGIVWLLVVANTINIGADLGAMADAFALLVKGPHALYVAIFAAICVLMQLLLQYKRYVGILKWLALALLAYVATLFFVEVPWREVGTRLLLPSVDFSASYLTMVVAIFGTTISPYLFFWQASQEVEDIDEKPTRKPLTEAPDQGKAAIARIGADTLIGMALSNLVAMAIMITAGAAFFSQSGSTSIESSAQAAEALRPIAGPFAFALFALGIIGTGLLAVPVLAGSAAYAVGEARRWPTGLNRRPLEAKAFYGSIVAATLVGMAMNFTPINPIQALFWSAVINGFVSVPVMAAMMLMARRQDIMGDWPIGRTLFVLGWMATVTLGLCVFATVVMAFL